MSAPLSPLREARPGAPWLSVLIPVYNVQEYLAECLRSVLAQADHGVEVLLVDDCSTDGSAALMRELASHDGRVRCLFHAQNQGLSGARNTLLRAASGDYVWFIDSDDYLLPDAISSLKRIAERHAPALVLCDFRMVRTPMKLKHRLRGELHCHTFAGSPRELKRGTSELLRGIFEAGQMHTWSKIARRSVWGDQLSFPVGRYFEDMGTTPLLALMADSWWYEPAVWVAYRQRPGSILRTPDLKKAKDLAQALMGLREASARSDLDDDAKFAWAHFAARNFISAARMADRARPHRCGGLIALYREAFEQASPISLRALEVSYLRRGWWMRALRLRYWLRRADSAAAYSDSSMSS